MSRPDRRGGLTGLRQAFDEARFGPRRTLNLREWLPTPEVAVARAERVAAPTTGRRRRRGSRHHGPRQPERGRLFRRSAGRDSIAPRAQARRRRGRTQRAYGWLVRRHARAGVGALGIAKAPSRHRGTARAESSAVARRPRRGESPTCSAISPSVRSKGSASRTPRTSSRGEMLRQFSAIASTIGDVPGRESRLRAALRAALDQHE